MNEAFSLPSFTISDYNIYRLDEKIFWTFIIIGLVFCVVHAARRAFRQPIPTKPTQIMPPAKFAGIKEMGRYTLFQRIYHWANTAAIFTLLFSGWMIYRFRPLFLLEGTTSEYFTWHRWGVGLLLVGIAFHVIYESFVARDPNPMIFSLTEAKKILAILKNFFGLSRFYPLATKYHPGQIFFHWAVAGNVFCLILTGFVLWKPLRDLLPLSLLGLGWDFIFYCRVLHGFFSATLIASLMGHIYFALFIKKNWTETKSMFTGSVPLQDYLESHALTE